MSSLHERLQEHQAEGRYFFTDSRSEHPGIIRVSSQKVSVRPDRFPYEGRLYSHSAGGYHFINACECSDGLKSADLREIDPNRVPMGVRKAEERLEEAIKTVTEFGLVLS